MGKIKIRTEDKILIIYILMGGLWFYLSDNILLNFLRDPGLKTLMIGKDIIFVLITGLVFYRIIRKRLEELRDKNQQLKINEERLELALEGGNAALWDLNVKTGEVIYGNRWGEILGYINGELGQKIDTCQELVHPDDKGKLQERLEQHLTGQKNYYQSEHRLKTKNGEWKWVLDTGKIISYDEKGEPLRVVGLHQDINARKEREEKLNYQRKKLKILNQNLEESYSELERVVANLENMVDLTATLTKDAYANEEKFLSKLLHTAIKLIPESDYGSIYIFDNGKVKFVDAVGHDVELLNKASLDEDIFDYTGEEIVKIDSIDNYTMKKIINDKNRAEVFSRGSKAIKQSIIFGLYDDEKRRRIAGISIDIARDSEMVFQPKALRTMRAFKSLASAFYVLKKNIHQQRMIQEEIILSMLQMLEIHDHYTSGHSQNVAKLAQRIAARMGLSNEEIKKTYWAGLVHDIGKTLVSEDILNKKGKLTDREYDEIKQHTIWGYQVLRKSENLKDIAHYVKSHHEWWDGKGYPEGLGGEEIPLIARIISLADAWDAMRSERSYRNPLPYNIAIREIKENRGSQFCPEVADTLLELLQEERNIIQ